MSDDNVEAEYIRFVVQDTVFPERKTLIWDVVGKSEGDRIGVVKWLGRWRQYCFFPDHDTVFNSICLRDIQVFLQARNQGHRKKRGETR
jgi:hypothetical protein